jgi:hypothetical protein
MKKPMNTARELLTCFLLLTYVCVAGVAGSQGLLESEATPCSTSDTRGEILPQSDHLRTLPQQGLSLSVPQPGQTTSFALVCVYIAPMDNEHFFQKQVHSSNANRAPPVA